MANVSDLVDSMRTMPRYTLMRGAARFAAARALVGRYRRILHGRRIAHYLAQCESRLAASAFAALDAEDFVRRLREDGVVLGLTLPQQVTEEIADFAARTPCFADRNPAYGFRVADHALASARLGKPVLVAQYFNTEIGCPAVARLRDDPMLRWIAGRHLGSVPAFVGANLWWTFPVEPLEADRNRHAHLFHRDVDDFCFFKYFFYLTAVAPGDGAHVCVSTSHRRPPVLRPGDPWKLRRYSDAEIERCFAADKILEICGPAGAGFAENTLCVHKGRTPTREPRLLLQLQFALFDYGVMHDRRNPAALQVIR
jgi:hypothetical protein